MFVSSASAMEIATKHRLGKLPGVAALVEQFDVILASEDIVALPINVSHAIVAGSMREAHADPFDRFLAAQAAIEQLSLVTGDAALRRLVPAAVW
jgi:PIN domain nuclease of toxin-antitoxin system